MPRLVNALPIMMMANRITTIPAIRPVSDWLDNRNLDTWVAPAPSATNTAVNPSTNSEVTLSMRPRLASPVWMSAME